MKRFIIFSNPQLDVDNVITKKIVDILHRCKRDVSLDVFSFADKKADLSNAEMIITVGGDGTILHAARVAADDGVPVLGVNIGSKGFMAELETDEIEKLIEVAAGNYTLEPRVMIDIELFREGKSIFKDFALNDAVVKGGGKVIDLTLYGDGQKITSFSGDGTVIATPTGSTAYSMSAGGPIVDPAAKNIILTPICAHVLSAKSFVLVATRVVTVDIAIKNQASAYLLVDGTDRMDIQCKDKIKVKKSTKLTHLVRLSDKSFYRRVSEKLGEKQ